MEKTKMRENAGGGRTWPAGRHSRPPARPCPGPPSAAARPLPLTLVSPSRPGAASGRREATLKTGLCFRTSGHVRPSRGARRAGRGRPSSRPAARRPPASGPHTKPSRPAAPRWLTPSGPPARPRRRPRPSPPRRGGTWPSHSDTSCKASLENAAGSFARWGENDLASCTGLPPHAVIPLSTKQIPRLWPNRALPCPALCPTSLSFIEFLQLVAMDYSTK